MARSDDPIRLDKYGTCPSCGRTAYPTSHGRAHTCNPTKTRWIPSITPSGANPGGEGVIRG